MKAEIKELLFSRNNCSVATVQKMLADKAIDRQELTAVLGEAIADDLINESTQGVAFSMQPGGIYDFNKLSNLVVLWGARSSGKTSVIASLLTLEGMTPIEPKGADTNSQEIQSRLKAMTNVFSKREGYQRLPNMSSPLVETYHARYKKGMRNYQLTFVEASIDNWIHVNELLEVNSRQIHIFCIDCRQDIDAQVADHKRVTELLIQAGHLQEAVGIYVLVTKADLMNAPELYWDNAAQTLVTTSMAADFWRLIRNKCKEVNIYNEQPVVCSVGDFVLKDYAKLKQDHTRRLCEDFILPKCEHNRWGFARLLNFGSKKMAVTVALLALAVLGVAGYLVHSALSKPPTRAFLPYDYPTNFIADVQRSLSSGTDYESACDNYTRLRIDLDAEHGIRLKDKSPLLPEASFNRCDTELSNAFASIMNAKMQAFFGSSDWSSDSEFMNRAMSQLRELNTHRNHLDQTNANDCQQYYDYLVCYRDSIKYVLTNCYNCETLGDVNHIVRVAQRWQGEYPFRNDVSVNDMLYEAPYDAYSSCTNSFVNKGDVLIESYNSWSPFRAFYPGTVSDLESSLGTLLNDASSLLDMIDDGDSEYQPIRDKLYNLIERIQGALED